MVLAFAGQGFFTSGEGIMPSRWVCLLIVLSWLGVMASLVQREVWPLLQTDAPPPYTIDFLDESRHQQHNPVFWKIYLARDAAAEADQKKVPQPMRAETKVEHRADESFAFRMRAEAVPGRPALELGLTKLKKINSLYRLSSEGQLLEIEVELRFDAWKMENWEVWFQGHVVEGQFAAHYKVMPPRDHPLHEQLAKLGELDIEPIPMPENTSILQMLHPVGRIQGLRPGQRWRQPQVNPLEESVSRLGSVFNILPGRQKSQFLDAHVLNELQMLPDCNDSVRCMVIEYDDEDARPRTWVQASTGLVLRQESNLFTGQRLILQRELIPREP